MAKIKKIALRLSLSLQWTLGLCAPLPQHPTPFPSGSAHSYPNTQPLSPRALRTATPTPNPFPLGLCAQLPQHPTPFLSGSAHPYPNTQPLSPRALRTPTPTPNPFPLGLCAQLPLHPTPFPSSSAHPNTQPLSPQTWRTLTPLPPTTIHNQCMQERGREGGNFNEIFPLVLRCFKIISSWVGGFSYPRFRTKFCGDRTSYYTHPLIWN